MGKLVFLDLVDRSGRIQLLVRDGAHRRGRRRPRRHRRRRRAARRRRGAASRRSPSTSSSCSAKITQPLPDTFHGLTDAETRYRKRYLDLLDERGDARGLRPAQRASVAAIRRYLDERGFVEVETPVLQPRYGGAFAEPFVTHYNELDADLYLRIATELYLKRLIVGGLEKVYEIGKDFRNEGISYKHQPEFTMLEWYEAYADYRDTMARIEELRRDGRARGDRHDEGRPSAATRSTSKAPWRRLTLRRRARGARALDARRGRAARAARRARGRHDARHGRGRSSSTTRSPHFVEPALIEPTILHDYPVELSPFARATDDDPTHRRALRVLRRRHGARQRVHRDQRRRRAGRALRDAGASRSRATRRRGGDPDYVEALSYGMPPTGGLGLGIDRLAMVLTGRETIRDVILFPALRSL